MSDTPGRRNVGEQTRRAVLGDEHVDRAAARTTEFDRPFQEYITEAVWGTIWSRQDLDRRTRSCVTLAVLTALGHHDELAMHVKGAVRNGLTTDEIAGVLLHTGAYAGVPSANGAFAVAERALAELDAADTAGAADAADPGPH